MAVVDHPRTGLRPAELRRGLGLSREKMADVMSVSAKTIENWERRNQMPADEAKRNRLGVVDELAQLGLLVYGAEGLPVFMQTPLRSLGNRTPLQEIVADRIERVIEILASEYEGLGF